MNKRKNKNEFITPDAILCEGADATYFIIKYLEYLIKKNNEFESFCAFDFGGVEELSTFLDEAKSYPGFDSVRSILILRDSELCFNSAVRSIQSALVNNGYPTPANPHEIAYNNTISVAYSLFPMLSKNGTSGTLENLILRNLKEEDVDVILNEVDGFIEKLNERGRSFSWPHKTKLHTYFSVTDRFVTMKLSEAVAAGAFNYECDEMNSLKELLTSLIHN